MDQFGQFISNHWQLTLAFILILLLIFINELIAKKKKVGEISTTSAIDMINHEHAVVVDIRDKEAFNSGHIVDSLQMNVDDFSQTKMITKYKNKKIILVCAGGLQSLSAAAKMRTLGYDAFVLGGGITAWKNAELPLVKTKG